MLNECAMTCYVLRKQKVKPPFSFSAFSFSFSLSKTNKKEPVKNQKKNSFSVHLF